MDLATALAGLVDHLVESGVRATDDPRDINPPCVHVRPPQIAFDFKAGGYTASWELWCIVPDAGRHQSLKTVSELIEKTQAALGWKAVDGRPSDALLNDGTSAPMYILTFSEHIQ